MRCDKGGTKPVEDFILLYGRGNVSQQSGTGFFFVTRG